MDLDNEPQPDALLRIPERLGGRSHLDADGYLDGAPEFIAEVASSSASYDTGPKKNAYRRNGVQEYLIWRVLDHAIDWYVLEKGAYERLAPSGDGLLRSQVYPGLWLDADALLAGRMDRVLEVLDQGLASPEHRSFRARCKMVRDDHGQWVPVERYLQRRTEKRRNGAEVTRSSPAARRARVTPGLEECSGSW